MKKANVILLISIVAILSLVVEAQRNAGVRGLTYDGENLWDIKGNRLSAIDTTNGNVISQYKLDKFKRAISLA